MNTTALAVLAMIALLAIPAATAHSGPPPGSAATSTQPAPPCAVTLNTSCTRDIPAAAPAPQSTQTENATTRVSKAGLVAKPVPAGFPAGA